MPDVKTDDTSPFLELKQDSIKFDINFQKSKLWESIKLVKVSIPFAIVAIIIIATIANYIVIVVLGWGDQGAIMKYSFNFCYHADKTGPVWSKWCGIPTVFS